VCKQFDVQRMQESQAAHLETVHEVAEFVGLTNYTVNPEWDLVHRNHYAFDHDGKWTFNALA